MMNVGNRMIPLFVGETDVGAVVSESEWLVKCAQEPSKFATSPALSPAQYYEHYPEQPAIRAVVLA